MLATALLRDNPQPNRRRDPRRDVRQPVPLHRLRGDPGGRSGRRRRLNRGDPPWPPLPRRRRSTRRTSSASTTCSATRTSCCATPSAAGSATACCREIGDWFEEGILPRELAKEVGDLGLLGMHLEGYGCAGRERHRLRRRLPRARVRRLRASAASSPCRARSRCSRSGSSAPRSRSSSGCRGMAAGEADRLLRADRARLRLRAVGHAHDGASATATTGSSTARRCGSPTAASPTSRSCGRRPTTASAASSSRPTRRASPTRDIHRKLSLRASVSSELSLEDVRLPADAVLPERQGHARAASCLNEARYGICWGASAPGAPATRRRWSTPRRACSTGGRSPASSSPSASSST